MNKHAINIETGTVAQALAGGALAGTGIAAALAVIRMAIADKRDAKANTTPTDTDKDTIVLTLPRKKTAEAAPPGSVGEGAVVSKPDKPKSRSWGTIKGNQLRCNDGTIGMKVAGTGWQTQTAVPLAVGLGASGGAMLIEKLYNMHREMKLKREIEQAKQEYLDMLQGGRPRTKEASDLLSMFSITNEKTAADTSFGALNYPISVMALLTMLGSGSTAYLTKKVLDEKLKEEEDNGFEPPKINRIVFKTASSQFEGNCDDARAAIVIAVQSHCNEPGPLADADVKMALAEAGMTPEGLIKRAQEGGISELVEMMRAKYPSILSGIQAKFSQSSGGPMGWLSNKFPGAYQNFLNLPGVRNIADNKTKSMLTNVLSPQVKMAKAPIGALLAAALGGDMLEDSPESIAKAVQLELENKRKASETKYVPGKMRIEAKGKAAADYVANNHDQIARLIQELAASGRL